MQTGGVSEQTENDVELLDETVEVEPPRRILGGSLASFAVLIAVAVGVGIALVTALALYVLPAIRTIAELLNAR